MSKGEPTEYEGIAAQFAAARAQKEKEEAQGLRKSNDPAVNKQEEVRFKAAHGIVLGFFGWIV